MIWDSIYLNGAQMKELDTAAMRLGISEIQLMENAGAAIYREVSSAAPDGNITVVCGIGNNGGDGYAVAYMLKQAGRNVTVIYTDNPRGEASIHFRHLFEGLGGRLLEYRADSELCANIIIDCSAAVIDALFGFSFAGKLSGDYARLTELINSTHAKVISADLPSGVYADGGYAEGCVLADITCTFSVNKLSTVSYPAYSYCGKTVLCDIGVPSEAMNGIRPAGCILGDEIIEYAQKRPVNSNKGTFGTLLSFCGSPGMTGAAYLSAVGALRSGVGLLEIVSDIETLAVLKNRLSEPVFAVFSPDEPPPREYNAFLVGCGIGREYDSCLGEILKRQKHTTVIDADGINYIASHINVLTEMQGDIILTPHPGEMARLMGCQISYVNENRTECARSFAMEFGCVLVLKGNRTVIASPQGQISICPVGGSALAKGGSGDVLAGVIASLAAQGMSSYRAACLGVYVHALAGDRLAAEWGEHGVLPHDLPREIGRLLG